MDPILGQIVYVPWSWTMRGWMPCNGQLLPISQYTALYSLLGNQFGGDSRTTFALPDLRPFADGTTSYQVAHNAVNLVKDENGAIVTGVLTDTTVFAKTPNAQDHSNRRPWQPGDIVAHIATTDGIYPSRD